MGQHRRGRWAPLGAAEMARQSEFWHGRLCPRCGRTDPVSFGAQLVCPGCGMVWQNDPPAYGEPG